MLPFTDTKTQGTEVPVWDIADVYPPGDKPDLLVRNTSLGQAFAAAYHPTEVAGTSSHGTVSPEVPAHPVVLMRGHGFTASAESLETALFYCIYTMNAARVQTNALLIRNAYLMQDARGNNETNDASLGTKTDGIVYLSNSEVEHTWEVNKGTMARPWALWVREVEVDPLYRNDV